MKPLIGVTTYRELARWDGYDSPAAVIPANYLDKVHDSGGSPVLLPPYPDDAADTIAVLDGLVVAGGADVDPARYGHQPHPETTGLRPDRDASELALIDAAVASGIPVLGICRGLQLLNVAFGGDLVQHVPDLVGTDNHRPSFGDFQLNEVSIDPDSLIGSIIGPSAIVSCSHHQAVGSLGEGFRPVAWAADGMVEAIEHAVHPFVVGVQWHPEAGSDPRLFTALVERAAARIM